MKIGYFVNSEEKTKDKEINKFLLECIDMSSKYKGMVNINVKYREFFKDNKRYLSIEADTKEVS